MRGRGGWRKGEIKGGGKRRDGVRMGGRVRGKGSRGQINVA